MSILAYTGLPGSGKSYSVVAQQVIPSVRQGLTVVTNLPLKLDLIKLDFPDADIRTLDLDVLKAEPARIEEFCPNGAVIIIDELWKLFPSGAKVHQIPEPFKSFVTEHRHRVDAAGRSQQIVFVSQDLAQVAAFARQLVETTFRSVKLTNVGMKSRFRVDVYNGPMSGPNPPQAQRLREIFYKYDPKIYRYYSSHTMSESGKEGADESPVDRRSNLLMRPIILTAPFAIGLLIWFGVHNLSKAHDRLHKGTAAPAGELKAAAGSSSRQGPINEPSGIIASSGAAVKAVVAPWRVSMTVKGVGGKLGDLAVLEDGTHVVWVELGRCRVSHYDIACPYNGRFWDRYGISQPLTMNPL